MTSDDVNRRSTTATALDGGVFHQTDVAVYRGDASLAHVLKRRSLMAHVCYAPAHANASYHDWRAGAGVSETVWIACEQGTKAEHIAQSGLEALIDTRLEPNASIGWHEHLDSEEYYLLVEGTLTIIVRDEAAVEHTFQLDAGDCHRVGIGMAHAARAGEDGARIIVIAIKP